MMGPLFRELGTLLLGPIVGGATGRGGITLACPT